MEKRIDGIPMFRVVQKLKLLKQQLRKLHRSKYSQLVGKVQEAKRKLDEVQTLLHHDVANIQLQQREKVCYDEFVELANAEISLYKQKTKVEWFQEMNHTSAFFHAGVCEKQARTRILRLSLEDGQLIENEQEIVDEFIRYYSLLLGSAAEEQPGVDMEVFDVGQKLNDEHRGVYVLR